MAVPVWPGAAFEGRGLVLKTVPAGEVWCRIYESRHSDALGWGQGLSRFADPTGAAFGLVYLGSSPKVAFVETTLRDRADGRGADCVVEMAEIQQRSLASIRPTTPLHLIDRLI
jgi:hypothetical protein